MANQSVVYLPDWPQYQYHQTPVQDVHPQYEYSMPQSRNSANMANPTAYENPPRLPPRPMSMMLQPHSHVECPSAPTSPLTPSAPSQYAPPSHHTNQSQQPFFLPPPSPSPSPSGQYQESQQPAQIRRRPVSMYSYPTSALPSSSFGTDEISQQPLPYYPPPPRQPLQPRPTIHAASASPHSAGTAQSTQQPIQQYYGPASQPSQHLQQSPRSQSTQTIYSPSIIQQSPSPSTAKIAVSSPQCYPPVPNQLAHSPSHYQLIQPAYAPSTPHTAQIAYLPTYESTHQTQHAIPCISLSPPATISGTPAQSEPSGLRKLWTKEGAKDALSKGKRFLVQTNKALEKIVEPMMPILAASDPEIAAAYAIHQRMKAQKRQNAIATAGAANLNGSETVAATQSAKEPSQVAGESKGLENLSPLLAALMEASAQAEAQRSGANVGQGGNNLEAILLASLLRQNSGQSTNNNISTTTPAIPQEQPSSSPTQLPVIATAPPQATTVLQQPVVSTAQSSPIQPERQTQNDTQNLTIESLFSALLLSASMQNSENQALISGSSVSSPPTTTSVLAGQPVLPTDTSSWVHYGARIFGLKDILLPANHDIGVINQITIGGIVSSLDGFFQFELLYNDLQVQNKIKFLSSLAANAEVTLVEGLSNRDFGINTKASMEGVLRVSEPDDNGIYRSAYKAILQSPHGHGIVLTLNAPSATLRAAKAYGAAMLSSITWIDRREICTDISASVVGSYRYYYNYSSSLGGFGSIRETRDYSLAANGRYVYDRESSVSCSVTDNQGNWLVDGRAYDPNHVQGVWEAIEYGADAGANLFLILTEDNGDVSVLQLQGVGGGPLMIEGKKFHKIN